MISVIIPIYNAAGYLPRTIQCLREQTCGDFEVLLVNDGSRDESPRICEEAARQDSRFRCVHQENRGVSAARNHGLVLSEGAYITFLDADDEIPGNYLQELLEALTRSGCQMSVCDVVVIQDGQPGCRFTCGEAVLDQREALNCLLSRRYINSGPCAKLFRREALSGTQFPPLKAYEDILFVMEVMSRCGRIASTDRTEYRYIQNAGSAMSAFMKIPSGDIAVATDRILSFLQRRKDLDPLCRYVTASHLMQYAQPLLDCEDDAGRGFIRSAQKVYRRHAGGILRCPALPWKEKLLFLLFAWGWRYADHSIKRIGG